jgi:Mg2+/Co2+ transporter CorC
VSDLLPFLCGDDPHARLGNLLRPVHFVTDALRIDDLVSELTRSQMDISVVLDDRGATAGVIALEHLLQLPSGTRAARPGPAPGQRLEQAAQTAGMHG